jgi:antagonist of KipI
MIKIIKPGLLTSIQDMGRFGFQKYGVISSGAMDVFSHRIANILTGNEENTPTIEITLLGPAILFQEDSLIAICGGDFSPSINDGVPIPTWKPVLLKKGTVLHFHGVKQGCYAYLAVAGGFSIPKLMNSTSTYLRAKIGGFQGRSLQPGDELHINPKSDFAKRVIEHLKTRIQNKSYAATNWFVSPHFLPRPKANSVIRVMKGLQYHLFTRESQERFCHEPFIVTTKSDRMGYRLQGPPLELNKPIELFSEAVTFGTVQVPSSGNPIILLADRQTTGGYPKIAQISSVDFPLIAQAKPGDQIYFQEITHESAQQLYIERERNLLLLKQGVFHKFY